MTATTISSPSESVEDAEHAKPVELSPPAARVLLQIILQARAAQTSEQAPKAA